MGSLDYTAREMKHRNDLSLDVKCSASLAALHIDVNFRPQSLVSFLPEDCVTMFRTEVCRLWQSVVLVTSRFVPQRISSQ